MSTEGIANNETAEKVKKLLSAAVSAIYVKNRAMPKKELPAAVRAMSQLSKILKSLKENPESCTPEIVSQIKTELQKHGLVVDENFFSIFTKDSSQGAAPEDSTSRLRRARERIKAAIHDTEEERSRTSQQEGDVRFEATDVTGETTESGTSNPSENPKTSTTHEHSETSKRESLKETAWLERSLEYKQQYVQRSTEKMIAQIDRLQKLINSTREKKAGVTHAEASKDIDGYAPAKLHLGKLKAELGRYSGKELTEVDFEHFYTERAHIATYLMSMREALRSNGAEKNVEEGSEPDIDLDLEADLNDPQDEFAEKADQTSTEGAAAEKDTEDSAPEDATADKADGGKQEEVNSAELLKAIVAFIEENDTRKDGKLQWYEAKVGTEFDWKKVFAYLVATFDESTSPFRDTFFNVIKSQVSLQRLIEEVEKKIGASEKLPEDQVATFERILKQLNKFKEKYEGTATTQDQKDAASEALKDVAKEAESAQVHEEPGKSTDAGTSGTEAPAGDEAKKTASAESTATTYEQARTKLKESFYAFARARDAYFSPDYKAMKLEIEELQKTDTRPMTQDKINELLEKREKLEVSVHNIENAYKNSKQAYVTSLANALEERGKKVHPEDPTKKLGKGYTDVYKAALGARLFAKSFDERSAVQFESITDKDAMFKFRRSLIGYEKSGREPLSYRERELALKEELLSSRKKGIFGKLKDAWLNKVPPSMKMALGGAAVGVGVASGGFIPVFGAITASLLARKLATTVGDRLFVRTQENRNTKARRSGMLAFAKNDLATLEKALDSADRKLKITKGVNSAAGYAAGFAASYGAADALQGVTFDGLRDSVGGVFTQEPTVPTPPVAPVAPETNPQIDPNALFDRLGEWMDRFREMQENQTVPEAVVPPQAPEVIPNTEVVPPQSGLQTPPLNPENIPPLNGLQMPPVSPEIFAQPDFSHAFVLEGTPSADTVSEQVFNAWKAGELNHIEGLPEYGEISSREFLNRMWEVVDNASPELFDQMHIESGDFNRMPIGDEYDAGPLLERMFPHEGISGATPETVIESQAPETSPRPEPRPEVQPQEQTPRNNRIRVAPDSNGIYA